MRFKSIAVVALVTLDGCSTPSADPRLELLNGESKIVRNASIDTLLDDLRTIARRYPDDCDLMLRNAQYLCDSVCRDIPWSQFRPSLERQHAVLEEKDIDDDRLPRYSIKVLPAAYVTRAGLRHDLRVSFDPLPHYHGGPFPPPDRTPFVNGGRVALRACPDRAMRDLTDGDNYPAGSAVDFWLHSDRAASLQAKYPIVNQIEISYGPWQYPSPEVAGIGFEMIVECAATRGESRTGGVGVYTVGAALDPPVRWGSLGDWIKPHPTHVPSREVGGINDFGGSEWRRTD